MVFSYVVHLLADYVAKLAVELTSKRPAVKVADTFSTDYFSELAKVQMAALIRKNTYSVFPPSRGKVDPVLSESEQRSLLSKPSSVKRTKSVKKAMKRESYLCMKMTRYLQRLFYCSDDNNNTNDSSNNNLLLVNSEEYKWIVTVSEQPKHIMKPDFFLIRRGLQSDCPESGSPCLRTFRRLPQNSDGGVAYAFGKLSDWCLRDCVLAVIEFKTKLVAEDFGELACYLQHLSRNDSSSVNTYHGMVCDSVDVWLVSCVEGKAATRVDTTWTSAGSKQFIRGFFSQRNPWCSVLDHCCAAFNVQLAETSAFLGRGASGRVFRVVAEDSRQQHAMKIVYSEKSDDIRAVEAELQSLRRIKAAGGSAVTVLGSPTYYIDPVSERVTGIGYLMAEMGSVVTIEENNNSNSSNSIYSNSRAIIVEEAFRELYHLHRLRQFHGDARLPNLLRSDGEDQQLLWIDCLRVAGLDSASEEEEFPAFVEHDAKTLLLSVTGKMMVVDSVLWAVQEYAADPSDATVSRLISAVWAVI
eukprot:gene29631-35767_t